MIILVYVIKPFSFCFLLIVYKSHESSKNEITGPVEQENKQTTNDLSCSIVIANSSQQARKMKSDCGGMPVLRRKPKQKNLFVVLIPVD